MADLVDRNLRQRFLPFVIDPHNPITYAVNGEQYYDDEKTMSDSRMQIFSFKDGKAGYIRTHNLFIEDDESQYDKYNHNDYREPEIVSITDCEYENYLKVNIAPQIRDNIDINDISFSTQNKVTSFTQLLNLIPTIQIREYTQDTRLDLLLSLVDYFKKGYAQGQNVAQGSLSELKSFGHLLMYDLKNIPGNSYWENIINSVKDQFFNGNSSYYKDSWDKKILIDFCYMMYYRMLTTTSTNTYILPFTAENIYKGNGYEGWSSDFGIAGSSVFGKFGALGNFLSPNINITTTPMWKGCKGGEGISLDMTINLFNDTTEHAIANFIFINTIIPQNLPTQYAILQQPPSLYDIKIEGFSRLFMCAGNFEVNYKGVMRHPNQAFIDELMKHVNTNIIDDASVFLKGLIDNNQLRIPDVYELKLQFKSLLPNTFNNFLFQFAMNGNITDKTPVTQDSWIENDKMVDAVDNWLSGRMEDAKEYSKVEKEILQSENDEEESIRIEEQNIDETETTISELEQYKSMSDDSLPEDVKKRKTYLMEHEEYIKESLKDSKDRISYLKNNIENRKKLKVIEQRPYINIDNQ